MFKKWTLENKKVKSMEGVGGGLVYVNFESASSEMDPEHLSDSPMDDVSLHHPQPYSSYLTPDDQDPGNFTGEEGLAWANETEQCWWNGNETVCGFNDTYGDYEDSGDMYSLGFKIAIAILYNSIFVTALLGNALVCYVVFSSPRMRTVTNYLIANLAVGDLLMAILCVPFSYIPILLQYWPFGNFLCYLLPPAQAISVLVSSYTLVALAADRYMAILYPLRPRFRRSQACWVIVAVWLIAIITASPIAIFTEYYPNNVTGQYYCEESGWKSMGVEEFKLPYGLTLMILQYFFPLTVLIFTYSRIAMAVWGKKSLGEAEDSRDQRLAKTKRKMIKMMLTVVFVYTVSWLPFNTFLVYGDIWNENLYLENRVVASYIYPVFHLLAMAHSVWNPVIYCYMNSRFREGFKAAISNVPCIWKLVRFCQLPRSRRSRSGGITTDSARRRMSYYSHSGNTRLTRTNTTCTTYTFGNGSLHNIHNTGIYHHQHHNYAMNNPLMMRKQSYLLASVGNGSLNVRDHLQNRNGSRPSITSSSILVSQYPKPNHLNISNCCEPSTAAGGVSGARAHDMLLSGGRDVLKQSNTMTSLAPGPSSSLESSPSSPGRTPDNFFSAPTAAVPMSCLKQHQPKSNGFDLSNGCSNGSTSSCSSKVANGKKKVSLKKAASNGNGVANSSAKSSSIIQNSSSYVTISNTKGGKEVVTTTTTLAGKKGKSKSTSSTASTPSSTTSNGAGSRSFLSRKRSSNSSGVSESFM